MPDSRHSIRILIAVVVVAATGCQTLQIGEVRFVPGEEVLTDGGDAARRRLFDERLAPPLEEAWRYNAAAGFGPGSPLLYSNAVIVGNRNGELHAIDLESGKKLGFRAMGESLEGPILIDGTRLYVASAWGKYGLTAFDLADGSRIWRFRGGPFQTGPVRVGERIVAVDVDGMVRALDQASGEELWAVSLGEGASGQSTPLALGDERLFVVSDVGLAMMIEAESGRRIWTRELGYPVYASPAVAGDVIIVPTTRGCLLAVSPRDGATLWTFDAGDPLVRFTPPAIDGEELYVGASNGSIYRLDARSGNVLWRFEAPDAVVAPPLLTGTHVYAGTMGRMLYVFERETNELVWEDELRGRIKSAMSARDGYLIVLTEPRYVYALKMMESDDDAASALRDARIVTGRTRTGNANRP